MKKKNNKGFTMIEIVAVVIIIGILAALIIPGVSKLMRQFREDYYEELEDTTVESAKDFFLDNKIYMPGGVLESSYVNVSTLISEKYQEDLLDYRGNTCVLDTSKQSYVIVIYKGNGEYVYNACLNCSNEGYVSEQNGTYCDSAWLSNTNITYDFGNDNEELYIYYGSSREEVREKLFRTLNVVKKNSDGDELERIVVGDKEEGILPNNIDEVDTTPVLDSDNKKVIPLKYTINNSTTNLNAIIYRHKEPLVTIKKIIDNTDYVSGTWSNGVIITLSPNDNYFDLSETKVGDYQWYVDGGWKNIECDMISEDDVCSISLRTNIDEEYKFRIVTNEGHLSEESEVYRIRIDADKPTVEITPNGGESIVSVGSTTGTVSFTLNTNDTGGSLIKSRKYAVSTSKNTAPTSFTNFYVNTFSYSENLEGNNYYVWSRVEDNAGNVSVNVWPSDAFKMKYEIKYNANGGTGVPSTQYQYHGDTLTLTNEKPTKTGYTFKGWAKTSSATDVDYLSGSNYSENASRTLYAVWEVMEYTVTWKNYDGTVLETDNNVAYGTTPSYNGATPTRSSTNQYTYTFSGWSPTVTTVTGDVTYTATYNTSTNKHTVTFDANGGSVSPTSTTVEYNSSITLPTPIRSGYTFNGWYTSTTSGSMVGSAGSSYIVTESITLYAQWEQMQTYTIIYNKNNDEGTTPSNTICTVDVPCTLATNSFTMANYHATYGWNTKADGSGTTYASGGSVTNLAAAGETVTLYSYYECDDDYRATSKQVVALNTSKWPWYTVTLDSTNTSILTYKYSASNLKKSYGCTEYRTNNGLSTVDANTCIADVHVSNGVWEGYYTSCKYCGKATDNKWCPVHAGGGSQEIGNGGTSKNICDAENEVYSNTTCVRGVQEGWTRVYLYKITFNANGGTVNTASKYVTSTDPYGTLPTPTNGVYTFAGWYTASSGGTQVTETTSLQYSKSHTLYAQWSATVTFDANNGIVTPSSATAPIGSTITLPTPTRGTTGLYVFNGWYTAASGGTKVGNGGSTYTVNEPVTLYAQWTRRTDSITPITPVS